MKKYHKKIIDFKKLSFTARNEVINLAYPLFKKRVSGWDFSKFKNELFNTKNKLKIKIQLIYNLELKLVGFLYMSALRTKVKNKEIIAQFYVIVDLGHTQKNLATSFCFNEIIKLKYAYFLTPIYIVDLVLSPIAYYQVAKYFPALFPRPNFLHEKSNFLKEIIYHTYKRNKIEITITDDFVGNTGEKIKFSAPELKKINTLSNKYIRFFVEKTKLDGNGLIIVLPITWYNLLRGCCRLLHHKIRKKIGYFSKQE